MSKLVCVVEYARYIVEYAKYDLRGNKLAHKRFVDVEVWSTQVFATIFEIEEGNRLRLRKELKRGTMHDHPVPLHACCCQPRQLNGATSSLL